MSGVLAPPQKASPDAGAKVAVAPRRSGVRGAALGNQALLRLSRPAATPVAATVAVGSALDPLEREAERVAEQVMRMPDPALHIGPARLSRADRAIQRLDLNPTFDDAVVQDEGEKKDDEGSSEEVVQTLTPAGQSSRATSLPRAQLSRSSAAMPLDASVRQFMEPRFGVDFGSVRVHADSRAAALCQTVNARAFTYGADVFFGAGEYRPQTRTGQSVIAHELSHVVQQGAGAPGPIRRLTALGKVFRSGVTPYAKDGGECGENGGPVGADYNVATDAGHTVRAWQGGMVYQDTWRYWCHGHTVNSYADYDYSVYSGPDIKTVIDDEWTNIPEAKTKPGDIAVWTASYGHSAIFTQPVVENGQLSFDKSKVSSKNGCKPVDSFSLSDLSGYGTTGVKVYRKKT